MGSFIGERARVGSSGVFDHPAAAFLTELNALELSRDGVKGSLFSLSSKGDLTRRGITLIAGDDLFPSAWFFDESCANAACS